MAASRGDLIAHSAPHRRSGDRRGPSRRRGAALEAAILRAAWDELAAVGYASLTMEGVAARARTSKTVLYRRWPNRAELVIAATRQEAPMLSGEVPDTGTLRGDVLALLRRMSRRLSEVGPEVIHGLLTDLFRDDGRLSYLQTQVTRVGADTMSTILRRAAERGEVDLDRVSRRTANLPLDLLRNELLFTRTRVPDTVLVEIVDEIFLPLVRA